MIKFYRLREEYGCFSNFSRHPIVVDGKEWATTEHYYQAKKFLDEELQEMVRNSKTPREAANLGRSTNLPLRADWEDVKDDVMRKAVTEKVLQHPFIKDLLLSTGDEEIVEDSPVDYYWGCGANGNGKNMLGKIFVEIREKLRSENEIK